MYLFPECNSGISNLDLFLGGLHSFLTLQEFIANEGDGEAPLEGSIPDMTSSTELYINLQNIYQAKAEADFLVIEQRVWNILKKIGKDPNSISKTTIKSFCRRKLKVSLELQFFLFFWGVLL
ncbi:NEDD8-activating enzyme E1 regulatory subunit AXR1-like isoform X2 [Fagus crenata]